MNLLYKLHTLQRSDACPIRTHLVTARGEQVADRCNNSLSYYGVDFTRKHFMSGKEKGPLLRKIQSDIFFDDTPSHIKSSFKNG